MVQTRGLFALVMAAVAAGCASGVAHARFLQVDPVGYKDQVNLYAYVEDDPINRSDPTGEYQRGEGFTDKEWDKFNAAQQAQASKMERQADRLSARAAAREAKGEAGRVVSAKRPQTSKLEPQSCETPDPALPPPTFSPKPSMPSSGDRREAELLRLRVTAM